MSTKVNIAEASRLLGVNKATLRRWDKLGKLKSFRTEGGHRRYEVPNQVFNKDKIICYARESSKKQSANLENQVVKLKILYPTAEVIQDYGSGLNFKRPGLLRILESAYAGEFGTLVVTSKDRLCRFGYEMLEWYFTKQGIKLEICETLKQAPFHEELSRDVISIITYFTNKYHGKRRYHNKKQNDKITSNGGTETNDQKLDEEFIDDLQYDSSENEQ